ncbi:MAG: AAA family ATPase [Promethearchaeota archaeon]
MSFNEFEWFKKINWSKNPFQLSPVGTPDLVVGFDEEFQLLENYIRLGYDVIIEGPYGSGKTSLLLCLETMFKDNRVPIFFYAPPESVTELIQIINIELKLDNEVSPQVLYHILRRSDDRIILLIDEAHDLNIDVAKMLRGLSDLDNVSIIFSALNGFSFDKLPKILNTLADRVQEIVLLDLLSEEEVILAIKKRIEAVGGNGSFPFTEDAIRFIAKISEGAPREAIKLCSAAIALAISKSLNEIDVETVEQITNRRPSEIVRKLQRLGDREKQVMKLFVSHPILTTGLVKDELSLSSQASYNVIARLMEKELVTSREAEGRGNEYLPVGLVKRILTQEIANDVLRLEV